VQLSGKWAYALPMPIVGARLILARVGDDMKWRPAVPLDDASYAPYLTHTFFMGCKRRIAPQVLDLGKSETIWFVGLGAMCIALGIVVHLLIEKPLQVSLASKRSSRTYYWP
jgi:peptidoglycan/LPS O-acetylase OafA/YrhL